MKGNCCAFAIDIYMKDKQDFRWYAEKIKRMCKYEESRLWDYVEDDAPVIYSPAYYSAEHPSYYSQGFHIHLSGDIDDCIVDYEAISFIEEFERCGVHLSEVDKIEMFYHEPCMGSLGIYIYEKGKLKCKYVPYDDIPNEDEAGDSIYDPEYYSNLLNTRGVTKEIIKFNEGVFCRRCHSRVFDSDVEGYPYVCYVCDENKYDFETYRKETHNV